MTMLVNPYGVVAAAATDPYFSSVTILCHFNGADLSTTLTNEIAGGPTVSSHDGNCRISTTQSVFGGASLRIQSGSWANLIGTPNAAVNFGTGDFTIEFRMRADSLSGSLEVMDLRPSPVGSNFIEFYTSGTSLRMYVQADRITSASGVLAANTWAAIALSRVSGTSRMFVDGTQVGSNYTDSFNYASGDIHLGISVFLTAPITAYFDELRVTKGVGRYSANYSIATSAFPNS